MVSSKEPELYRYVESVMKGTHPGCLRFFGVGGCHASLLTEWKRTLAFDHGAPVPERGSLSAASCAAIASVLLDSTRPPSLCISCQGDLCAREAVSNTIVPQQSLVSVTGLFNSSSGEKTKCTSASMSQHGFVICMFLVRFVLHAAGCHHHPHTITIIVIVAFCRKGKFEV